MTMVLKELEADKRETFCSTQQCGLHIMSKLVIIINEIEILMHRNRRINELNAVVFESKWW